MAGGQERVLRRRIRSIQSTKKITKAMELIAASQIVRAQDRIAANRPYREGMARIVLETALGDPMAAGRLLGTPEDVPHGRRPRDRRRPRPVRRLQLVGAPGHRAAGRRARRRGGVEVRLFTVGQEGPGLLPLPAASAVERSFIGISERPTFADARRGGRRRHRAVRGRRGRPGAARLHPVPLGRAASGGARQLLPLPDPETDARRSAGAPADGAEHPVAGGAAVGYTEFEPDAEHSWPSWRPGPSSPRSSPRCSRPPRRSSPPSSGRWPPPPTTPTS